MHFGTLPGEPSDGEGLLVSAPPGATRFSLTVNESTGIGRYSYTATGLLESGPSTPFIVQVEAAWPAGCGLPGHQDNLGDVSNLVSYP